MISGKGLGKDKYTEMAELLPKDRDERASQFIKDVVHKMGAYIRSLETENVDINEIAERMVVVLANVTMNSFQFLTNEDKGKAALITNLNSALIMWIKKHHYFSKTN